MPGAFPRRARVFALRRGFGTADDFGGEILEIAWSGAAGVGRRAIRTGIAVSGAGPGNAVDAGRRGSADGQRPIEVDLAGGTIWLENRRGHSSNHRRHFTAPRIWHAQVVGAEGFCRISVGID